MTLSGTLKENNRRFTHRGVGIGKQLCGAALPLAVHAIGYCARRACARSRRRVRVARERFGLVRVRGGGGHRERHPALLDETWPLSLPGVLVSSSHHAVLPSSR